MSELFGKKKESNLFVPDAYNKPTQHQVKQVRFEDIPDKNKELVKCKKCAHTLFEPALQHYKIKLEGQIIYANKPISVCRNCGEILPDKP